MLSNFLFPNSTLCISPANNCRSHVEQRAWFHDGSQKSEPSHPQRVSSRFLGQPLVVLGWLRIKGNQCGERRAGIVEDVPASLAFTEICCGIQNSERVGLA